MPTRLKPVDVAAATGKTKEVLDTVQKKFGKVPNVFQIMANSPAAVQGYLNFNEALAGGLLDPKLRELIAITVAEVNICEYCLSAHYAIGKSIGLSEADLEEGRNERSSNPKWDACLSFARLLLVRQGDVTDANLEPLRAQGVTDGEITEIIANVALNVFTNYFNKVAQTEVDFPKIKTAFPV